MKILKEKMLDLFDDFYVWQLGLEPGERARALNLLWGIAGWASGFLAAWLVFR